MDDSLLQLMEELVASIELREAADPDTLAWEGPRRIDRLEDELVRRVPSRRPFSVFRAAAPDEVLAGSH